MLRDGACPHYGDCDFESDDTCLWANDPTASNTEWIVYQGGSVPSGKGPSSDHTAASPYGHYLNFYDAYARLAQTVRIESPPFDRTAGADPATAAAATWCLEFWYYMTGANANSAVSVYQKSAQTANETLVWKLPVAATSGWQRGSVAFDSSPDSEFTVILEATSKGYLNG